MSLSPVEGVALAEIESPGEGDESGKKEFVGRSPGQLALARLKRDRTALISGGLLAFFVLVALAVPLIEALYGVGPKEQFQSRLDGYGMPLGYAGGVTGEHWFGWNPVSAGTSSSGWCTGCGRRCSSRSRRPC